MRLYLVPVRSTFSSVAKHPFRWHQSPGQASVESTGAGYSFVQTFCLLFHAASLSIVCISALPHPVALLVRVARVVYDHLTSSRKGRVRCGPQGHGWGQVPRPPAGFLGCLHRAAFRRVRALPKTVREPSATLFRYSAVQHNSM